MLDLLMPRPRASVDTYGGAWYSNRVKSLAGVTVDEEIALTYAALWCAARVICEAESSLAFPVYERDPDNVDRREAYEHPVYDLLSRSPNALMAAMPFRYGRTQHQFCFGNGFAEIERDSLNRPVALWPIHPGRVKAPVAGDTTETGQPVAPEDYLVRNNNGGYVRIEAQDMLHVPGCFPEDGRWGKGVVAYHREHIGAGLGADRVAATQFGSGNVPRVLIRDSRLSNKDQRREFRREWKEIHGSPDSAEVAIVWGADASVTPLSFSSQDSQFLESRRFSKEEIATIARVPLHMLKARGNDARNNVEQLGIEFVVYDLILWLRGWEGECNLKLFRPQDKGRYFAQHRTEGLIRGDMQARYGVYKTALMIGLLSVNECRRFENLPGIGPDGDQYFCPLNLTTLKAMRAGKVPPSTGGRGLGSDQSGSPAGDDKPDLLEAESRGNGRVAGHLRAIEQSMRAEHRAAMLPVPPTGQQTAAAPVTPVAPAAVRDAGPGPEAARGVALSTLAWLLRKEAAEVQRHLKRPDFPDWLTDHAAAHEAFAAQALAPVCELLQALGASAPAGLRAAELAAESRRILLDAYDTATPAQVQVMLADWPTTRATAIADRWCCAPAGNPDDNAEGDK